MAEKRKSTKTKAQEWRREQLAMAALPGILSAPGHRTDPVDYDRVVNDAYEVADRMIAKADK